MVNEVVISGIGGKFPECYNFEEFKTKILNGDTLMKSDPERSPVAGGKPPFSGKIPEWRQFDPSFFGLHPKLAQNSDPAKGLFLERSFESMVDSGMNPFEMKGRNVAVLMSMDTSEANTIRDNSTKIDGYGMIGHAKTMMANRLSYFLNFTGPSFQCDNAGTGGMLMLEMASKMIGNGEVEAAVVAASNTFLFDSVDTEYESLKFLSPERKCYPFDDRAEGLVRCEGVVAFFLQRASDARKSYCSVLHAKTAYLGDKFDSFISMSPGYEQFLKQFYKEAEVDPVEVAYIEANSCSIHEFDAVELNTISKLAEDRTSPLLIGSLAGNTGYSECVSGLMSVAKAITALETGIIPKTLNYCKPNSKVQGLLNGSLKPVTANTPLEGDLVAVTTLGLFGSVGHVLLKRSKHEKPKHATSVNDVLEDGLPRLLLFQARNETGAQNILNKISNAPLDTEFIKLVNDCFKTEIPAYMCRGYTILPHQPENLYKMSSIQDFDPVKRPVWYIFSGMGSQWAGMGQDLLQFPVFAAAIDKCDKVLRPRGLDIRHIITTEDSTVFHNILNCFVGIAAIQIGLVNILSSVGISPDGMIGHSVGELGCAYADGCFTAEQMILAAYARGQASLESELIPGMMAAVGKGYQEMKDLVPDEVDIACHNSSDSCTLSGPSDVIHNFVNKLQSQNIFARAVSAGGIAYHSRYIKAIGTNLLKYLKKEIPHSSPRSNKWISSSVPEAEWNTDKAKLCSAEYHTNNLLSPVLFEEACRHVPKNAILVEIAPRGLLQAILKRSIAPSTISISLTNTSANVICVLSALGKLYMNNVDVDANALYPPVEYPVSRNTPGLAPLVTWHHDTEYYVDFVRRYNFLQKDYKREIEVVDVSSFAPAYLDWKKSTVAGKVLLPLSSLLIYTDTILKNRMNTDEKLLTIFENVKIRKYLPVESTDQKLLVNLSKATGYFEMTDMNGEIMNSPQNYISGTILKTHNISIESFEMDQDKDENDEISKIVKHDLYNQLSALGYQLEYSCQNIEYVLMNDKGCTAEVKWTGDCSWFLNAIFNIVMMYHMESQQKLLLPTYFNKLIVDFECLVKLPIGHLLTVYYDERCNRLVCNEVELLGITLSPVTDSEPMNMTWNKMKLLPYFENKLTISDFIYASLQLAAENSFSTWKKKPVILESTIIQSKISDEKISKFVIDLMQQSSNPKVNVKIAEPNLNNTIVNGENGNKSHLVVGSGKDILGIIENTTLDQSIYFLVYFATNNFSKLIGTLQPILTTTHDGVRLALLKAHENYSGGNQVVKATESNSWLEELRQVMNKETARTKPVILYSKELSPRQVLPVLALEPYTERIRTVFVRDEDAPDFQPDTPFYRSQLKLGLPVNILSNKIWSSLRVFSTDIRPRLSTIHSILKLEAPTNSIHFVGLNSKSVLLTDEESPVIESLEVQFLDYSGIEDGQKVMGVAAFNQTNNSITLDPILRWEAPDSWSLEDLVTIPAIYTLAYFGLIQGKFNSSKSVLVHLGKSLLGQALIRICLDSGATVFASVEDDNEAIDLQKQVSQLQPANIIVCERQELKTKLKLRTKGQGVDLIFSGHKGKYLQEAISLTSAHGIFLHLRDIKVEENEYLGLAALFNNTTYQSICLKSAMDTSEHIKQEIRHKIQMGIKNNKIKSFKRTVFNSSEQAEATRKMYTNHMSTKSVIAVNLPPILKLNCLELQRQSLIIAGKTEFWVDVVEWLVNQGIQKMAILNSGDEINHNNLHRLNLLIDNKNTVLTFASPVHLDSKENARRLLEDLSHVAFVSSIFCINKDEDSSEMRNLDLASREVLPELEHFVCLLGGGTAVSESREASGLPVISVQSRTSLESPRHILPYLATILQDSQYLDTSFYCLEENTNLKTMKDSVDFGSFLPSNKDELLQLSSEISDTIVFHEEVTLSPGYAHVSHCLLPLFIIPGLGSQALKPLIKQLIIPAFCSSLPSTVNSIHTLAETLLTNITRIQNQGPYNILGESWSGPVALAVSLMLEAKGHQVRLFLIEGAPHMVQNRINALYEAYDHDIETGVASHLYRYSVESQPNESVSKLVQTLKSLFTSLAEHKSSSQPLEGRLVLTTRNPVLLAEHQYFSKMSNKTPTFLCTYDVNYEQLLTNPATASFINEHLDYSWKY